MKVWPSMLVVAACASFALAQPHVSGTVPPELQASESRQWMTVVGTGFTPESTVTLAWGSREFLIPTDRTEFVNPQSMRVFAGIFPADPTWTVTLNPPRPKGRGFPRQSAAIPEGVARLATSTAAGAKPALARTFLAAFRSRSTRTPQAGQWNVRSDKLNRPLALAWQLEQSMLVCLGSTSTAFKVETAPSAASRAIVDLARNPGRRFSMAIAP